MYDRRTEVSKMETVNYILIWRHASRENLSRAHTSDSLSFAVTKGDSVRLFRHRFSRTVSIIRVNYSAGWIKKKEKEEKMIKRFKRF